MSFSRGDFLLAAGAAAVAPTRILRTPRKQLSNTSSTKWYPVSVYGDSLGNPIQATAAQLASHSYDGGTALNLHRSHRKWGAARLRFSYQWYFNKGFGEELPKNSGEIITTVEYPLGHLTQVLFSGKPVLTIQPGQLMYNDELALTIPPGEYYYVRTFVRVPKGGVIPVGLGSLPVFSDTNVKGLNNYIATGGDGSDQTMTLGTAWGHDGGLSYGPTQVLGVPIGAPAYMPIVSINGDSWAHGGTDLSMGGYVGRACEAASMPFMRVAQGGESAWEFGIAERRANRMVWTSMADNVFFGYGSNDIPLTYDGSTFARWKAGYLSGLKAAGSFGANVFQPTIHPRATSTDHWATAKNQTPANDAYQYMRAELINPYFRSGEMKNDAATLGVHIKGLIETAGTIETDATNTIPRKGVLIPGADRWYVPPSGAPTQDGYHPNHFTHAEVLAQIIPVYNVV